MTLEVFPVIHINEVSQVLAQAEHCYESGADGIYLIDHNSRSDPTFLVQTYNEVDDHYPGRFIGLNFLQLTSGYSAFLLSIMLCRKVGFSANLIASGKMMLGHVDMN